MKKIVLPIKGMHCKSCEILIHDELIKIKNIIKTHISHRKGEVEIFHTGKLELARVSMAINDAGYKLGSDEKEWITRNPSDYKDLFFSFAVLIVLYFILSKLGLFNMNMGADNSSSLPVVLLIGLTAGFSTCMALVGGLVLGISARFSEKNPAATPIDKFRPHLFFMAGRILSYILLGGIIGWVGSAFQLTSSTLGILTILVGIVMLVLGLQLTELFPRLSSGNFTLPAGISKLFGISNKKEKEYSHNNSFLLGALTFFLPCGFTQAMQLYAISTGSFVSGALIMGIFALGTAPGLLGIGGLTSIVKGSFAKKFFKFAGIVVVFLALFNISNGANLTGISAKFANIGNSNSKINANDPNVKLENGVQVIRMRQDARGYSPSSFTIRKDTPVKWVITSEDSRSCSASIFSLKLNIKKYLEDGENIIEFTPKETGKIAFSCSMGMYKGVFYVIDKEKVENPSSANLDNNNLDDKTDTTEQSDNSRGKENVPGAQVIKAVYTADNDIQPKEFTVKIGQPVRLEVEAKDDGEGCMGSLAVPDFTRDFEIFKKGEIAVLNFTPTKTGRFYITCAMGVSRGAIKVE